MKKILIIVAILFATLSHSQSKSFKISGNLISEGDNTPLESATVYLQRVIDSSLITYTITDKNGKFVLEGKTNDKKANLYISYVGYQTYFESIDMDKDQINLENIHLKVSTNALDEVLIKSLAPVTIKKDTLEFNVNSFKTKENAVIEDLLKELPGVEVDEDGNIKVNGKAVNKILVNGKPFFGSDPTITTKNLSKDIIEKIQVSDTKTDAEAFAGEEGDKNNKTINLVIKEENNKGVFGRAAAGVGTDKRYEAAGMFNYFDNDQRISILAGQNNINSPGFSFGEIRKMLGGGNTLSFNSNGSFSIDGRSFGAGEGITTSRSLGANYADELGKKLDVSANYFNSNSDSENESTINRENILPDSRFFNDSHSKTNANTDSHDLGMEFKIKPDSTLLITVQPKFGFTKAKSIYKGDEQSYDEDRVLTNESTTDSYTENSGHTFSNNLSFTRRFGNKGAFLKLDLFNDFRNNESDDYFNSTVNTYGSTSEEIIRNQYRNTDDKANTIAPSITYRLPIKGKEWTLDFKYLYRQENNQKRLSSYDFDNATQDYDTNINQDLSTDYENKNKLHSPSTQLGFRNDKLSTNFEFRYLFRNLENNDLLRPNFNLTRKFETVELSYYLSYRFGPQKGLYFNYRLNNNAPNISQLQAFSDVTNPLNIITGNPFLKPTTDHNLYAYYDTYNVQKGTGFYFYINSDILEDYVVAKRTVNADLTRETTYVNVNGAYRHNGSINYNKKVKIDSVRTIDFSSFISTTLVRSVNFNNDVQYTNNKKTFSPGLSARFVWKDVLEFRPYYYLSFTNNKFSLDNLEEQNLVSHSMNLNTVGYFSKKLVWRNDIRFSYNPNIADDFQKSIWFWNSTLAYTFMKDKATLTLKVYDLLNQNNNATRTVSENYIQDSQNTVLKQYFMLSFSWKFNTLGKAGESNDNMYYGY
ncbi:outer membrane beta-barrel protein [Confluentibacter sediminis]|uniref:outer membrane beta-barrel protein n=1 Tax=Confluentibacter sediminis TaxID=2219045 RepID=UPI000DAD3D25|nr:outer membrane beta-barrel protein [Confluentibacter sediminis]